MTDEQAKARKNAVLERMQEETRKTEGMQREITESWLRLTKGFSPTAIAQAIANDKQVRDILNVATSLANAFEQENASDQATR